MQNNNQNPNQETEQNPNLSQQEKKKLEQIKKVRNPDSLLLRYGITIGICLVLSFILIWVWGIFDNFEVVKEKTNWNINSELTKNMYILTNSTFVVGIVCAGFGLLVVASNGGAFEMFVYGMRRFFSLFQRDVNKVKFKTFYDYHVYRSSEPKRSFAYLLIVGGAFLALSGVFLAVYLKYR